MVAVEARPSDFVGEISIPWKRGCPSTLGATNDMEIFDGDIMGYFDG